MKKNNKKRLKKENRYDCIYHINKKCLSTKEISSKCIGSIQCKYFTVFSRNQCKVSVIFINNKLSLSIIFFKVNTQSFLRYFRRFIFNYKYLFENRTKVFLTISLKSHEDFIRFLFNEFNEIIKIKNETMNLIIENPKEIQDIMDIPYTKIPALIIITRFIENEHGELKFILKIPKDVLFSEIKKLVPTKIININQKQNSLKNTPIKVQPGLNTNYPIIKINKKKDIKVGIAAIVLNDNRKCTNDNHIIQDILAKIRISTPAGQIIDYEVPAAYCTICDTYFILKSDFKKAKKFGIILCQIEDKTQRHLNKANSKFQDGSESKIHQLGYNVVKGNGYTNEQRHTVLANILENTNISKHEIMSNICRCIAQHQSQSNYSESVSCWKNDLEFINCYQLGDIPEVKVNKIIIGKR